MEETKLIKATILSQRIKTLRLMKRELRPEHCNGVGVCGSHRKNDSHTYYQFNLWSTHRSNTDDNSLIMRTGITAMYNEVCKLLEAAEEEFKQF